MERMQISVTWLLRIGVTLALLLVCVGGMMYLLQHAHDVVDYRVFRGESVMALSIDGILSAITTLQPRVLIQLGVLVLIITQILRVAIVAWHFMRMRDYIFALISTFVLLAVLAISFGLY